MGEGRGPAGRWGLVSCEQLKPGQADYLPADDLPGVHGTTHNEGGGWMFRDGQQDQKNRVRLRGCPALYWRYQRHSG